MRPYAGIVEVDIRNGDDALETILQRGTVDEQLRVRLDVAAATFDETAQRVVKLRAVLRIVFAKELENAVMPIFDLLWLIRSLEEFVNFLKE